MATHVMKYASVPVACAQASRASDACGFSTNCQKNVSWGFYGVGWLFEGIATILALVSLSEPTMEPNKLAAFSLGSSIARDVFWGIACISSISHIKKIEKSQTSSNFKIGPTFSLNGAVGLQASLSF